MDLVGKIGFLDSSGGKFAILLTSVLMVRIVKYGIIALNSLWIVFLQISTTTVLNPDFAR